VGFLVIEHPMSLLIPKDSFIRSAEVLLLLRLRYSAAKKIINLDPSGSGPVGFTLD
jgi:hypothetical protein